MTTRTTAATPGVPAGRGEAPGAGPAGSPLDGLFAPRSVAVVGASADPGKAGHQMLASLGSFPGPVVAINPKEQEILGRPCYPAVADVPGGVDLAVLTVPPGAVPDALAAAGEAGARGAVVCAGGFAETGSRGASIQARVVEVARATGVRVLGPNTSGFVNPAAPLVASFVPGAGELRPGGLGVVAQSGGIHHVVAFLAAGEGLGISLGVGLGNAADVSFQDVVDHLGADPATRVIALHVEGASDGRALHDAVARTSPIKPVVALVLGQVDPGEPARSHTGALAGDWALTRAALRQAGAVVVGDTEELVDAAAALGATRLGPRRRAKVGVVTGQAGPGLVATDTLRAAGVDLAALSPPTTRTLSSLLPPLTYQANPVDTGRPGPSFGPVVRAVAADPGVDVVLCYALVEPGAFDPVGALDPAGAGAGLVHATGGPPGAVGTVQGALSPRGVPVLPTPERGGRAVAALVRDAAAAWRREEAEGPADPPAPPVGVAGGLDEDQTKAVLEAAGLRCPRRFATSDRDQAEEALGRLRPPLVVKVCDAGVAHKSEVGGVRTGVIDQAGLAAALDAVAAVPPTGHRRRYLVEEEAPRGVELIIGGRRDPSFGPVVLVGLGGLVAEAVGDVALRLAPVGVADVEEMVAELTGAAVLGGFRGMAPVDPGEVAGILGVVGALLAGVGGVEEVDLNPVRATAEGLVVLDALVVGHRADAGDVA